MRTSMLQNVRRNLQEQAGYVGILLVLGGFFGYYLYLTFGYSARATWFFPRIVIILGILFVSIDLLTIAFSGTVEKYFSTDEESAVDVNSTGTEEEIAPVSYVLALGREIGWLVGYMAGVYYIGFFTTTFLYSSLYIMAHRDGRDLKTAGLAVAIGLGLVVFLWLLFVELMNTASIFRLGYFP